MRRLGRIRSFHVVFLVLLACSAWAEVCKGNKVPRAELAQYDADLVLSSGDREAILQTHLPWGEPACPKVLMQREYVLCYDPVHRIPVWAAYQLRAQDIVPAKRLDAFRSDPRLSPEENAACADYAASGYDRGHLVPRDDMNRFPAAQANTFYLSNMTPQVPAFNRGSWEQLERFVRAYAKRHSEIYVLTGDILGGQVRWVPSGRVAVPTLFYKVLLRTSPEGVPEVLTILLPNRPPEAGPEGARQQRSAAADAYLAAHTTNVREVERLTGLDLLPKLNPDTLKSWSPPNL